MNPDIIDRLRGREPCADLVALRNEAADLLQVSRIRLEDLVAVVTPAIDHIPEPMRNEVVGTLAAVRQFLGRAESVQ